MKKSLQVQVEETQVAEFFFLENKVPTVKKPPEVTNSSIKQTQSSHWSAHE